METSKGKVLVSGMQGTEKTVDAHLSLRVNAQKNREGGVDYDGEMLVAHVLASSEHI